MLYLVGMVVLKISSIHWQVISHTAGANFMPLEMTRFSRQLVPDLASCSLSETHGERISLKCLDTPYFWTHLIFDNNFAKKKYFIKYLMERFGEKISLKCLDPPYF